MKDVATCSRASGWRSFSVFVAFFLGCMACVFQTVLPKYAALIAPDSMPYFSYPWRTLQVEALLSGTAFTPHSLYWLLLPPLHAHEATYIVDSLVLALGGVYYLRSQRIHPLAAWCGGLALGLSGYTFTLFCAGHRGYFHMCSYAVWAFGLIARGFETRKLLHFALVGLVFAWGVPYQPDVLVLFGALAAAYVVWRTVQGMSDGAQGPEGGGRGRRIGKRVVDVWPRFLVSAMVFALCGFGGIRSALTTQLANRDAQIADAMGRAEKTGAPAEGKADEETRGRWIFATNWSLPPEDVLEFVVPGVFGNASAQLPYPYWGRLGRPDDSVFQKGRMMPNFRQHTVYLGLVPVLLALVAVWTWFPLRRPADVPPPQPSAAPRSPLAVHSDVPFWLAVWVVCLVLAMGRYTPLYRLFYSIPYMDYIRAPVKFHHLVEVATAFLAGFGMDAFLRADRQAARRRLLWLSVGMAGLMLVGALIALAVEPLVIRHITELGLGPYAETLSAYVPRSLLRAAGLAALVAGLVLVAIRASGTRAIVRVGYVLAALLAVDQVVVARRYVGALDLEAFYVPNTVVKAVKEQTGRQVANVANYATPNALERDWFSSALAWNGIRNMVPTPPERGKPYGKLFEVLQRDPLKLWRVLHVQYVIAPRKASQELIRSGALRPLLDFEFGTGTLRRVEPSDQSVVLAAVVGSVPGARAVTEWNGGVAPEAQTEAVGQSAVTVSEAPPPAAASTPGGPAQLKSEAVLGLPLNLETRLTCVTDVPVLVLFTERYGDSFETLVDGRVVPCYLSDGLWASTLVPAGTHRVVLRKKRDLWPASLSLGASLGVLLVAVFPLLGRPKRASVAETPA